MSQQPFFNSLRPRVAIICTSLPPYRIHFHQRIVKELPQIQLATLCTHEDTDTRWQRSDESPPEIFTVHFGLEEGKPDRHGLNWRSFRKGGRIIKWLREHDFRAVVVLGYSNICRWRIIRWCRSAKIPCFIFGDSNIKGDTATGMRASIKHSVVGWAIRNTTGQFACGTLGKAYFEKYGAMPENVYFVPYEPNYDEIQNLPHATIHATMSQFGLSRNRNRLVFSGRFVEVKRPDLLLEAFCEIASQRRDWDLLMIGDGPMREYLQEMVPPELKSRVIWTGFLRDQVIVSALYRASDVLVLPSSNEPWALVVNEAVAAGMAIVASDVVGAAAELVHDAVNGRIFPTGNLESLKHRLLDVTTPGRMELLKSGSAQVLADWRRNADPVDGLRRALIDAGVLSRISAR